MTSPPQQLIPERSRVERLEARVTAAQKALIQRAADLEGRTVTCDQPDCAWGWSI